MSRRRRYSWWIRSCLVCSLQVLEASTWNQGSIGGSWNVAGNWTPSGVPNSTSSVATFPSGSSGTVTLDNASITIEELNFQGGSLTINPGSPSGTLTFDNGTGVSGTSYISVTGSGTPTYEINVPVTPSQILQIQMDSTGTLVFSNSATVTTSEVIQIFSVNGTGLVTIGSGEISAPTLVIGDGTNNVQVTAGGALSGTNAITLNGPASTLNATGSNLNAITTAAGTTLHFTGGNIQMTNACTINGIITGTTSQLTIAAVSSTISFTDNSNTFTAPITIFSGNFSIGNDGQLGNASNSITFSNSGAFVCNSSFTTSRTTTAASGHIAQFGVNSGQTFTYNGQITGAGSLELLGPGIMVLGNTTNNYTAGTIINGGVLQVSSDSNLGSGGGITFSGTGTLEMTTPFSTARAVTLNGAASIQVDSGTGTLTGAINGSNTLTASGVGVLALTNSGNSYSGLTTISSTGTLSISGAGSIASSSGVTISSSAGTFDISGASGSVSIAALNGVAGSFVTLGGNTLTITGASSQAFAGQMSGTGGLQLTGTGNLTLTGANSYQGTTTIGRGTLTLNPGGSIADSSNVSLVRFSAILALGTSVSINNLSATAGSQIQLGSGNTLTIAGTSYTTIDATISSTSGGVLTYAGNSDLVLTATNTYAGGTIISGGGTVIISTDSNLGTGGVTFSGSSGTLEQTATIASFTHPIAIGAGVQGVLQVDSGATVTNTALISGATGSLGVTGAGVLILTATESYGGGTTVSGTLELSGTGSIAASSGLNLTASGATFNITPAAGDASISALNGVSGSVVTLGANSLNVTGATTQSFAGAIGGTGGLTQSGASHLTLSSTNGYSGLTTISSTGTLSISGAGSIASSSGVTISPSAGTFDISGASGDVSIAALNGVASSFVTLGANTLSVTGASLVQSFAGQISGMGGLTQAGTGNLTLTGSNSYSGPTTISSGTLTLNPGVSITNSSSVNLTSASSILALGTSLSMNNLSAMVAGSQIQLGSGNTLTINGSSNTTIAATISSTSGGSLTYAGSGDLTLSGPNSYAGTTTVSGGGTVTISTNANLGTGSVTFSGLGGTLEHTATIASFTHPIAIAAGVQGVLQVDTGATVTNTAVISGATGALSKTGAGTLALTVAETYGGATTVSAGTLALSGSGSIADSSSLTVSGTFDISQVASSTIQDLLGSGTIAGGDSTLTLGTGNSTTWSGVIQNGGLGGGTAANVTKQGSGTLTVQAVNSFSGLALIEGGGTVDVAAGAQWGSGALQLGGTLVAAGSGTIIINNNLTTARTLTMGAGDGTMNVGSGLVVTTTGTINGSGQLTKQGSGKVDLAGTDGGYTGTIDLVAGRLNVNMDLLAASIIVQNGATLAGTGRVGNNVTINSGGTLAPGNSPGTITVGSLTFTPGSIYHVEISPALASNTIVTGSAVSIPSGVALDLVADPGNYSNQNTYVILQDALGISGTFSNVTNPFVLIGLGVIYDPTEVLLTVESLSFSTIVGSLSPNAQAVANYLDANAPLLSGTDLFNVVMLLKMATSIEQLNEELLQLQPSHLKGLGLAQESSSMQVNQAFALRANSLYRTACIRDSDKKKRLSLWGDAWGDFIHQEHYQGEVGFHVNTGGALLGLDYAVWKNLYLGVGAAYTYGKLNWNHSVGKGTAQGFYGLLYATWFSDHFFVNGALLGAYNHYTEKRSIHLFTTGLGGMEINRHASADFGGGEGGGYFSAGALFTAAGIEFSPFVAAEYYYLHQGSFTEAGAQSIDLKVNSCNADLLRSSMGLGVAKCYVWAKTKWIPQAQVSVVREERFTGSSYRATMKGNEAISFTVYGMKPSRTLVAPVLGITGWSCDDRLSIALFYNGEFNANYQDQQVNLQLGYGF